MMTDPIGDLLTRIRNALRNRQKTVKIPASKLKVAIAEVLKREGYIIDFSRRASRPEEGIGPQGWLDVQLKYGPDGEEVICKIDRISRPGRRVYREATALKPVLNGLGIEVLSTPRGVLSNREARRAGVGGEVLARIY